MQNHYAEIRTLVLSQKRADNVMQFMISQGVRPSLVSEQDSKECMGSNLSTGSNCADGIRGTLKIRVSCSHAGMQTSSILGLSRFVPLKIKRRDVETRIIIAAGNGQRAR